MTPAELRTAHDALGVSTELIAARVDCHVNMIWRYESPARTAPIPEHVADAMRDLLTDFDLAAERLAIEVRASESGVIPRYADLAAFYAAVPSMDGWGERSQGLLVSEVQRRIQATVDYVR